MKIRRGRKLLLPIPVMVYTTSPEAAFLDEIQTKVLRVFLQLLQPDTNFFKLTQPLTYFYLAVICAAAGSSGAAMHLNLWGEIYPYTLMTAKTQGPRWFYFSSAVLFGPTYGIAKLLSRV